MSLTREAKIEKDNLKYCISRVKIATLIAALLFAVFGATSYSTLLAFKPDLTLFDNIWPRLLYVSLPFLLLYTLMRQEKIPAATRLVLWCLSFAMINFVAACIHVWPIALTEPKILLYFSSNNNLILVASSIFLALPGRFSFIFYSSYATLFLAPVLYLASADPQIFYVVGNDIFLASAVCFLMAIFARDAHRESIGEKHEHLAKTAKYIDKELHEVLEGGGDERSLSGRRNVFILQMDIRHYTAFLKEHDADDTLLLAFSQDLNALIRDTVSSNGGKMHKTLGDGYLCLFSEKNRPNLKQRQRQLARVIQTFFRIHNEFSHILVRHGLPDMRICGGIHFGSVLFDFFGSEERMEFDVVSKNLALAGRLEQHTKYLQSEFGMQSFLVLSSEAHKFFDQRRIAHTPVRQVLTHENENEIRSFPEISEIFYISAANDFTAAETHPDDDQSVA